MPAKAIRSTVYNFSGNLPDDTKIHICDILVVTILLAILGFTFSGVYDQTSKEELRLQEDSIICIKDFEKAGCNPFNLTDHCKGKMDCIKHGDGLGLLEILDIINKHIKNNGAIPIFMLFVVLGNEVRRRFAS